MRGIAGAGMTYGRGSTTLIPRWSAQPMSAEGSRTNAYWPIGLLKTIARLPHEYNIWIAQWHSVPDGGPAQYYAPGIPPRRVARRPEPG